MPNESHNAYAAAAELSFIRSIGQWSKDGEHLSRVVLLQGYLIGLDKRVAGFDGGHFPSAVREALRQETTEQIMAEAKRA